MFTLSACPNVHNHMLEFLGKYIRKKEKRMDLLLLQITVPKNFKSICFPQWIGAQKRSGLISYKHSSNTQSGSNQI